MHTQPVIGIAISSRDSARVQTLFDAHRPVGTSYLVMGVDTTPSTERTRQSIQRSLSLLHRALRPNGSLLLGSAETTLAAESLFEASHRSHRVDGRAPDTWRARLLRRHAMATLSQAQEVDAGSSSAAGGSR